MDEALFFRDRVDWRNWLEKNHERENQVWMIHYRKHSSKRGVTLEEAVEEAICFGWIDGKLKKIDDGKYALRYSPRKANSVWSQINRERAERLIESGRMTESGLVKIEDAKKFGHWFNAYTNKDKERMPSDLRKALVKDYRAWGNFQNFANTYRNMYIGWVNGAKTDITRKKRIDKVVEQSLQNKKYVFL